MIRIRGELKVENGRLHLHQILTFFFLLRIKDTEATRVANFNILRVANFWCLIKDTEFNKISSSEFVEPQASNYQRQEGVYFTTKSLSMKGYVPSVVVSKIEDETHLLLDCQRYSSKKDILLSKIATKIDDIRKLWHENLISQLMNSNNYYLILF